MLNMVKDLKHPNIMPIYEIIETKTQIVVCMEYCSGGNLNDYITKHKGAKLDETEAK